LLLMMSSPPAATAAAEGVDLGHEGLLQLSEIGAPSSAVLLEESCGRHGVVGHGAAVKAAIAKNMMRRRILVPRVA